MKSIQQQIEIDWPVKPLFHYVADISNNAAWQPVTRAEWLEGSKKCPGSRFTCQRRSEATPLVCEVLAVEPYQKRTVTVYETGTQPTYSFEFEPRGGSTLLKLTVQFDARGLSESTLPEVESRLLHHHDLARLKRILENEK